MPLRTPDTALFASPTAFRGVFEQGLERLLESGDLNLFILVAANASFDTNLFADLREALQQGFAQQVVRLREAFIRGDSVGDADDDLLVFLKMACAGFESLSLTERRRAEHWEVQFNHLRAFRPLRNSQRPMTRIHMPFDSDGFHFNRDFLRREALWSGELQGKAFDLFYNKYPFVELHSLLVPERERCLPQYHLEEMHHFVWNLVEALAPGLPGVRVGYNALGAYASVNHLHYQLSVRDDPLPVEQPAWRHNGGGRAYPVDCQRFESADAAWAAIASLQADNEAYNLLFTPGCLYCMPRRKQGDFPLASWSNGFSWYEMSGGMITFNQNDYTSLQAARIHADLEQARLAATPGA